MIPNNITRDHIIAAIREISHKGVPLRRQSRDFILLFEGKSFPPKYVISVANRYANGSELDPATFSGGIETNSFLEKLGFKIEEISLPRKHLSSESTHKTPSGQAGDSSDPMIQKEALKGLLQRCFGAVETEASFHWLIVPDWGSMDNDLVRIVKVLSSYRGYENFFTPDWQLHVDYYMPSRKLIIEYDERQHFTVPRAMALRNYPVGLGLGFDKNLWISNCEVIRATDPDPRYRDEQRAFYDSLRDIIATRRGFTVIRIKHKDYDWTRPEAGDQLNKLLPSTIRAKSAFCEDRTTSLTDAVSSSKRQAEQPAHVVTVCVLGKPIKTSKCNSDRQELLKNVIGKISSKEGWSNINALLLPGGFFCFEKYLGPLSYPERVAALERASFHKVCVDGCRNLARNSPSALIVAGVDIMERPKAIYEPDQLCVAWSAHGIAGIGRKVFPTDKESRRYVCYREDYTTGKRIVALHSGRIAVLCACYDMFGCAETADTPTPRTRNIRNIGDDMGLRTYSTQKPIHARDAFKNLRRNRVSDFQNLLAENNVTVGLAAIHENPTRYWQVHGIQANSAALNGGLAIGAAHFDKHLPDRGKRTLAATGIPKTYLSDKPFNKRQMIEFPPRDGLYAANNTALVRLFEL